MTVVYIVDVGQGNMAVIVFPDNFVIVYDCNITNANENSVFKFVDSFMPKRSIDIFVNSHRDADHMRGISKLNQRYPINALWDSGVSGNTSTPEYQQYMAFRRQVTCHEVSSGQYSLEKPNVKILNGKRAGLEDQNAQSIVLHIDHIGSQILLAGDTDSQAWSKYIIPEHQDTLRSLVLYASHHGSYSFFNTDAESYKDYTYPLQQFRAAISVISVGEANPHGHPHPQSLAYYNQYCRGADNGQRIFRTDQHGNMRIELHGNGRGHIAWLR